MIRYDIKKRRRNILVTIEGHAGYDEPGKDIVCAGASALAYALAQAAHHHGELIDMRESNGYIAIKLRRTWRSLCRLSVLESGMALLGRAYPDFVEQGRISENDCDSIKPEGGRNE